MVEVIKKKFSEKISELKRISAEVDELRRKYGSPHRAAQALRRIKREGR